MLTDNQLDHIGGLLSLRETDEKIPIYCTQSVDDAIRSSVNFFLILEKYCPSVSVVHFPADGEMIVHNVRLKSHALEMRKSKYAPFDTDVIALGVENILYSPCVSEACLTDSFASILKRYDTVLFDGTFETNHEMPSVNGHVCMHTSEAFFLHHERSSPILYVHVNNSNKCTAKNLAHDGLEFPLRLSA